MTPLITENLDLKFEDNIAYMSVSGQVTKESLHAGYEWFGEVAEANEDFNICVDMAKADFPDLSAVADQFRNISNVLRVAPTAEKCAILSDSVFVRNSAKVEGAVIPGLDLQTFKLDQAEPADKWLKGEPLLEQTVETLAAEPEGDDQTEASAGGAWDSLNLAKVDY